AGGVNRMSMYGQSEPVTLARDVKAVVIPAGDETTLAAGRSGFITQALGGSFTVYVEGNLFRIAGKDADALGKEPMIGPQLPPNATDEDVKQLVWHQMRSCYDPEIPINIVDLGLVYSCEISHEADGERIADIKMTLTAPGCGMGEVLIQDVKDKVELVPTIKRADVELVFDPPWNQSMMSEAARLQTGMM
ncbi:MAG TPA: putative Fe-S cluster assembly protein SufT, partial [Steroidobacter sp.]|nr:putative Fe-S cluster assembly protein SufT [Steroidobacter sp.]